MVHAFIMVKTGAGTAADARDRVADLDGVVASHVVAGKYDVIAEVEGSEMQDVLGTVSNRIGTVAGVTETKTYISLSAA
ncbi:MULTISPECIES: Lrp/AsnC family transcriptional regulator [Halobacterium]|uniref:Lrp/AsnC family transcriptional regulator n=1 Tax=Halobacterium TaxID=2239 RepID=UPI001E627092|nr:MULTISPECIES: Lrp/AsnC ligand binding domain-containing protein [Halobacterium]MCD2202691.1 Lrp/AsnC ligand binding domain-containing protein [Halobacterium sp. KA-6]UHH24901.1 Lrp/AsnC ligand binding domain-containing protein [Halobacterium noricense]